MFHKTFQILQICLIIAVLFLLYQFIHMGWIGYISDSEIWIVNLSKNFSSEWFYPWVITRPLFYGTLAIFTAHAHDAIAIFDRAKIAGILNGLLIVFFTYRLATSLIDPKSETKKITNILSITLLLSHLGFLNQGYRIRSDLFACTLILFALENTLEFKNKHSVKTFFLWITPLFCTPKAALNSIPFLIFPNTKKQLLIALELFIFMIFTIIIIYPKGLEYFADLFFSNKEQQSLTISVDFYFWRLLKYNIIFFSLFGLRSLFFYFRIKKNAFSNIEIRQKHINFGKFVALSVLIMCLMPDKVPFFLATFLPIMSIYTAFLAEDIFSLIDLEAVTERRKIFYKKFLIFSIFMITFTVVLKSYDEKNSLRIVDNKYTQYNAIKIIEKYLNNFPKAEYYDVIGIVPQRSTIRRFAGPHDEKNNLVTAEWIKSYPPNLLFYVQKFAYLEPSISQLIDKEYFSIGSKAFARWDFLTKPINLKSQNRALLENEIKKSFESVGAINREKFSALIKINNRKNISLQITEKDFFSTLYKYKNSKLIAISPFSSFSEMPGAINSIFRFDIGY